jgi:hypothetical protein
LNCTRQELEAPLSPRLELRLLGLLFQAQRLPESYFDQERPLAVQQFLVRVLQRSEQSQQLLLRLLPSHQHRSR